MTFPSLGVLTLEIQKVLKYMLENASWFEKNKQTNTTSPVHLHHTKVNWDDFLSDPAHGSPDSTRVMIVRPPKCFVIIS